MSEQPNQPQYNLRASQRIVDLMARLLLDVQKTSASPLAGMTAAELMQWLQGEVDANDLNKQHAAANEAREQLRKTTLEQAKQAEVEIDGKKYKLTEVAQEPKAEPANA